jgi:hypothetical protein
MTRQEIFTEIERIRSGQDALWPRDERRKKMYATIPPHVLLLETNVEKLRNEWYLSKSEDCIKRFTTIAALAVRALEEITPFK